MRILAAGGGSGGHVTPVAAVLREIKQRYPDTEIRFWCDRKFGASARSVMHKREGRRVDARFISEVGCVAALEEGELEVRLTGREGELIPHWDVHRRSTHRADGRLFPNEVERLVSVVLDDLDGQFRDLVSPQRQVTRVGSQLM